jgi:hypothetical protein
LLNHGDGTFGAMRAYFPGKPSETFDLNPSGAYAQYATANFTSSGRPDLVMLANGTSGTAVSVLESNGDRTFKQPPIQTQLSNPSAPQFASALAGADMNGDGKADLVFAWVTDSFGTNPHISVALGNGDGTFQAQQDYVLPAAVLGSKAGFGSNGLVLADLRGTGKPDAVFLTGSALYVMLNNGDGTLAAPTLVDSRPWMNYLAVQSLRGNGIADIAVALRCNIANAVTGGAVVYLGKGDGTFQAATAINPGFACPSVVSIADMNGDNKPDLIFAGGDTDINATSGFVGVFPGNGDGTFQSVKTTAVPAFIGSLPTGIAVTNAIGNRNQGVVLGELGPFGDMFALPGNGDGTFGTTDSYNFFVGMNSRGLQAVDLTGQGTPDLIFTSGGAEANGAQLSVQVFPALKPTTTPPTVVATTTSLQSSAANIVVGQALTLTATVAPQSGSGVPTGTVTFLNGAPSLGSGTLDNMGTATLSTGSLAAGTYSITAQYSGDTAFAASTSPAVGVTVAAPPPPSFSISLSPTSESVTGAGSVTTTVTITPVNGFNQTTSFACSGLPADATCSFSPATVTPSGGNPATSMLTVQTGVMTAALRMPARLLPLVIGLCIWIFGFAGGQRKWAWGFGALVFFALVGTLAGCGGGSSPLKTPAGSSRVTITATAGQLSKATSFTLQVQ